METDNKIKYLRESWGKEDLYVIRDNLCLGLYEIFSLAYSSSLQNVETANKRRHWTEEEDRFLKDYSNELSIGQACNLLYRSRYATYQRVKMLNLTEMIGK